MSKSLGNVVDPIDVIEGNSLQVNDNTLLSMDSNQGPDSQKIF